ncbi:hypothetical protein [Brunnivagina elsteri]|uniref:Uncharacterized protein n=1 Tax=Brunnivagina elsteri CCALA 953 TaxID=987040 RepID=A0A2A2TCS1_9CYAN|nr:hypothetical protein [Calothrix elsteri]PAX51448.1 hypothetical protein CK510_24715 [Calothrix elsteri CCALA 953]
MNLAIKSIQTATLMMLLSYATATQVVAVAQKLNRPVTVTQTVQLKDTLVIPGERVGLVTRKTTKANLVKLFGQSRLKDETISGAEGIGKFPVTRVNLGSQRSFTVVWNDNTRTKAASVIDFGSAWKTPEGIGVRTTFDELRQKLGEFKLYGLGWDYSGTVLLETTKLAKYKGKLGLQVDAARNASQRFPKQYQAVLGDATFSSANPNWKPLGMRLVQMNVSL